MTKLLQINSSLFSGKGVSTKLANEFVEQLRVRHPGVEIVRRDLTTDSIPHLDGERLSAIMTPPEQRTTTQQLIADFADDLIRELQEAEVLVIGAPMYNFSIPSTLKAWFDHVARAGVTFRYTENGPEGLLKGKKAYVFTTRGGRHRGAPTDSQTPFVQTFLGFLGITDVEFIYAEGLNMGEQHRRAGLDEAGSRIEELLAA